MDIVGKVCVPRQGVHLRCGSGAYSHAICVNAEPFILVSPEGDMLWGHSDFHPSDFIITSQVDARILETVMRRYAKYKLSTEMKVSEEEIPDEPKPGKRDVVDSEVIELAKLVQEVNNLSLVRLTSICFDESVKRVKEVL